MSSTSYKNKFPNTAAIPQQGRQQPNFPFQPQFETRQAGQTFGAPRNGNGCVLEMSGGVSQPPANVQYAPPPTTSIAPPPQATAAAPPPQHILQPINYVVNVTTQGRLPPQQAPNNAPPQQQPPPLNGPPPPAPQGGARGPPPQQQQQQPPPQTMHHRGQAAPPPTMAHPAAGPAMGIMSQAQAAPQHLYQSMNVIPQYRQPTYAPQPNTALIFPMQFAPPTFSQHTTAAPQPPFPFVVSYPTQVQTQAPPPPTQPPHQPTPTVYYTQPAASVPTAASGAQLVPGVAQTRGIPAPGGAQIAGIAPAANLQKRERKPLAIFKPTGELLKIEKTAGGEGDVAPSSSSSEEAAAAPSSLLPTTTAAPSPAIPGDRSDTTSATSRISSDTNAVEPTSNVNDSNKVSSEQTQPQQPVLDVIDSGQHQRSAAVDSIPVADAKDVEGAGGSGGGAAVPPAGAKAQRRKKQSDYNRKTMDGGDMDAFAGVSGNEPEVALTTVAPPSSSLLPTPPSSSSPAAAATAPPVAVAPTATTATSNNIPVAAAPTSVTATSPEDELDEEARERLKVSRKNEENLRVSAAAAAAAAPTAAAVVVTPEFVNSQEAAQAGSVDAGRISESSGSSSSTSAVVLQQNTDARDETVANDDSLEEGEIREDDADSDIDSTADGQTIAANGGALPADGSGPPSLLKYSYKDDQWSPLNQAGKKQYDRSFLLQLKEDAMSIQKPQGLPSLDILKSTPHQHTLPATVMRGSMPGPAGGGYPMGLNLRVDPFMPTYLHNGNARGPQVGGGMGGGPGGGRRISQPQPSMQQRAKRVITLSSSLNQDVKLHQTDNAWKPLTKVQPAATTEVDEEETQLETLSRTVRGILNKMTPERFDKLTKRLMDLDIRTEERLRCVIDLIFDKALSEPSFSEMYAKLCHNLYSISVPKMGASPDDPAAVTTFRKLLLTKCQAEFERDKRTAASQQQMALRGNLSEEEQEELDKARRLTFGLMRFIGELYNGNMLTSLIMMDCLTKLYSTPDEDSLECLCKLLTTIGKQLDQQLHEAYQVWKNSKQDRDKRPPMEEFDNLFNNMKTTASNKKIQGKPLSSRVIFMLKDVLELRARHWVPRRDDNAPKTLEQIQREAQQEKLMSRDLGPPLKDEQQQRGSGGGRSGGGGKKDSSQGGGRGSMQGRGSSSLASRNIDVSKLMIGLDAISHMPSTSSKGVWSKGSSAGGSSSSRNASRSNYDNSAPAPPRLTNSFNALSSEVSTDHTSMHHHQRSAASSRESSRGRTGGGALRPKTPSLTRGREDAAETVRNMLGGAGSRAHSSVEGVRPSPPPTGASSDGPTSSQQRSSASSRQVSESMDRDTMVKLAKLSLHALQQQSVENVAADLPPKVSAELISVLVTTTLETRHNVFAGVAKLIQYLLVTGRTESQHVVDGFKELLEFAEDIVVDVPKLFVYVAELIAPNVSFGLPQQAPLLTLAQFAELCALPERKKSPLFVQCCRLWAASNGAAVAAVLRSSGIPWEEYIIAAKDEMTLDAVYKMLECGESGDTTVSAASSTASTVSDSIARQVDGMLRSGKSNDEVAQWVEERRNAPDSHVTPADIVRALAVAIFDFSIVRSGSGSSSCQFDKKNLEQRLPLLQRFVGNDQQLQIQVLLGLQAVLKRLEFPQNVLNSIMLFLYEEELITTASCLQWRDHTDEPGKGVAISFLHQFFIQIEDDDD